MPLDGGTSLLEPATLQRLAAEAALEKRAAGEVARSAIDEYIDRKIHVRRLLREAAAEAERGVFISGEAVEAWMESWDGDNELPEPQPDIYRPQRPA